MRSSTLYFGWLRTGLLRRAMTSQIRIAFRDYADFEHALAEEARLFEAQTPGTRVELVPLNIHTLHHEAIAGGGLRDGCFDLALLVTDWLAEGMAAGALEDLLPWHALAPLPDWPGGWARSLVRPLLFGDRLSSIPWHDGPECLVYRSDLFSDSVRCTEFAARFGRVLSPPRTWSEFEEVARFFTDHAANVYGTVFAALPDGHNTLYDFVLQLWSRGGELADAAGRPQLTTSQAIASLDFYRRIVRDASLCHTAARTVDSTGSGELFLAGQVAMMANWFGFAARAARPGSPLEGRVGIAPVPASPGCAPVSLSVFWALGMGSGSRNKETAWKFLRFVASAERDLGITRHGAVGTRLSTWRDAALQAAVPCYREIERISLGARTLPSGPATAAFASVLDGVILRALDTDDSSTLILTEAQQQIDSKGLVLL